MRLLRDGETIDEFSSYAALRSVSILRDRFMLNGRPYILRMVLDQGYRPDTLMAAPTGLDPALSTDGRWGYSAARTAEEFAASFERLLAVVVHTPLFGGFCYTQFSDTFQEANGLLLADRTPKIPLERITKATRESRTHNPGGV